MGYQKAEQILPEEIIKLIQNYVDGACIYIPRKKQTRRAWGENTSTRMELQERNRKIFAEYQQGRTVSYLAEHYFLSEKSIQRILREQRK